MFIKRTVIVMLLLFYALLTKSYSQSLSINTDGSVADSSAILDAKSTAKGILIPRMTLVQKNQISLPATGLLVFQTDNDSGFYYYNGTSWLLLLAVSINSNANTLIYSTKGF